MMENRENMQMLFSVAPSHLETKFPIRNLYNFCDLGSTQNCLVQICV